MVKIESVTAKIFLIWTNIAKTNVDWTNISIMVGSGKDGSRNLPFKVWSTSVTAEIFLIWTNVAKTNVDWTNINLIFGICSRCYLEVNLKVSSKLGH